MPAIWVRADAGLLSQVGSNGNGGKNGGEVRRQRQEPGMWGWRVTEEGGGSHTSDLGSG